MYSRYRISLPVFNFLSHSYAVLAREISSWTLEEIFHIYVRPCILLYIHVHVLHKIRCKTNKLVFVSYSLISTALRICMFSGFIEVGGYNGLWEKYGDAMGKPYTPGGGSANVTGNMSTVMPTNGSDLSSCFKLTPYWDHMFRPIDDPDYPWLGLWTTLPIMGIWYWCTDQVCPTQWSCVHNYLKGVFSERSGGPVSYTYQLFLNHRHEIFILVGLGFLKKSGSYPKMSGDSQRHSKDFRRCFEHFLVPVPGSVSSNIMWSPDFSLEN